MSERVPQFSPPFFEFKYAKSVPHDWNWISLSDVVEPKQWQTLSQSSFLERGFPVYGANEQIGFYSEYNHEKQVIAVSCRGACGDIHLTKPFSYVTSNAMCLDNISDEVDEKFLYFGLIYRTLQDTISGSAQPQITGQSLQKVKFPAPPLPEQKKIASILTSVDEVIETTQKQIDKLQDLKKATMNKLLTKGIGHTEFKDSELGRIPKSWEVKKVEEVSTRITDGEHQTPKRSESGYFLLSARNIRDGYISTRDVDYVPQEEFEKLSKRITPSEGDVLISCSGSVGRCALVPQNFEFAMVRSVAIVKPNRSLIYPEFLKSCIESELVQDQIKQELSQSAQPNLFQANIKRLRVPFPVISEQKKIFTMFESVQNKIILHNHKLSQTQSLKKSLMQDLLTGKVRVQVN